MAAIHLMRHGQASFGADDYDKLSKLGREQAQIVGKHYREHLPIDAIFCGTLTRHQETLSAFLSGLGRQDLPVQAIPELNEFDHQAVIEQYRPEWRDRQKMREEITQADRPWRYFQEIFVGAVKAWVENENDYRETWPEFKVRVAAGFAQVRDETPAGARVLVVTSGGPISVMCQQVLQLDDMAALNLNHTLKNASVSEVLFRGDNMSLSYFNDFTCLLTQGTEYLSHR